MSERVEKLESELKRVRAYAALLTVALLGLVPIRCSHRNDGILRVRGLIIEDEQGRERILLGAPIPPAANRVRTDLERVKEVWAPIMGEGYMKYYENYRHDMNGLLILDENGFDRLAVGDPTPDPNIGRRIARGAGIEINDERGFERTGWGLMKVDGNYRIVLGLDSADGTEGMTLALHDEGKMGLEVKGERSIFVGSAQAGTLAGASGAFHGLRIAQGDDVVHEINALANPAGGHER